MARCLRTGLVILLIFLLGNIMRRWDGSVQVRPERQLPEVRDSITAYINVKSGMYSASGFLMGFHYTLLSGFADSVGTAMKVQGSQEHMDCWQMLADGMLDIVVTGVADTVPAGRQDEVCMSMPFRDYVWVVRKSDCGLLEMADVWLGALVHSSDFKNLEDRFFRSYDLSPYIKNGTKTDRISPYDDIIRHHSRMLGWDWRLLSAVIFKESRFSMGAYSRRGAIGLMQVKRSTAAAYGITNLFDPDENVRAGALFLKSIEDRYADMGLDSINVVKFTLAAYNAGESRINDCMNFTSAHGGDCTDWDVVAGFIPLMGDPEYYEDADYLRHGRFRGSETVRYVNDVLEQYEMYREVVR